jgi:DNA mismatch repair ATPase MutS
MTDEWAGRGDAGLRYADEEHPYAADLDLFGRGCLFELLSTPCTHWGQDTLAAWLCRPADIETIRARQAAVAELRPLLDLREELAVLAREVPETNDLSSLAGSERASSATSLLKALVAAATLSLLCLAGFVASCWSGMAPAAFLVALSVERGLGWPLRRRCRRSLADYAQFGRGLEKLAVLVARLERGPSTCTRLSHLRAELTEGRRASRSLARLHRMVRVAPYAPLLLVGTPLLLGLEHWRRIRGQVLERWLSGLGELEALCAVAAQAFENPDDPFPEIVPDGPYFEAEQLGHPLLPRARCVLNDVRLNADLRLLIVSGSNMAGKSTFLRTVGINAVLALAGAPVRARRLRISPLVLEATLRVQDSLQTGRSRFYAEVLRVRQVLDLAKGRPPVLFLLDELFQGTNSQDRRAGAEGVVRILLTSGAMGLVTTHDLALTELAEALQPLAANVHFEDRFENGVLAFDYQLRPGVVQSSNGLALMRAVGIDI